MKPTAAISLRQVTEEDRHFLYELYCDIRAGEIESLGWSDQQREAFLRLQHNAQHQAYAYQFSEADHSIITVEGRPAGRIWVHRDAGEIRLVDISLLSDFRSRGAGTFLVEQLKDEAARTGKPLRLQVAIGNRALGFYERLGFTRIGATGSHFRMEWSPTKPGC